VQRKLSSYICENITMEARGRFPTYNRKFGDNFILGLHISPFTMWAVTIVLVFA
jgi:hypothetical protein